MTKNSEIHLAIHGGKPVRTKPMPRHCLGANLIGSEERELVNQVIDSKSLFRHCQGRCVKMVDTFEKEFREYIGIRYALAVSSGSGALFCALNALNIGPGDEVVIPAFGWITDYNAVELSGAKAVFADIDNSLNLNPEDFEAKITKRTKAAIVIHYQGAASRLDEIVEIARRHGVKIIEDAAQAVGGAYNGKTLGTWGDVAIFSFQHNKIISSGEGGVLVTNDQDIYERAVRCHDLGVLRPSFKKNLEAEVITRSFPGFQWRMNELTGAVALAQLRKLPTILAAVKSHSTRLRNRLTDQYPAIKLRQVVPVNDLGIVLEIDFGTNENRDRFNQAYAAEGLTFGATSGCGTLNQFDPVIEALKRNQCYEETTFLRSRQIEGRMAGIALLPVYDEQDMKDIETGALKVIAGLGLLA